MYTCTYADAYAGKNFKYNFLIEKYMKINEIFYSIQGEGKWMGIPNIFIRTSGCNLRCNYCDTKYAYYKGDQIEIPKILKKISKFNCKKICITGGEPLLQKDINNLIDKLIKNNYQALIETNGSIDLKIIENLKNVSISLDIKCPSSKMQDKMIFENIFQLDNKDQLKFVIETKKDYEYAKKIIKKYDPKSNVFFQPVWGLNIKKIANWILNDNLDVILGVQLHKIIWGEKAKGR